MVRFWESGSGTQQVACTKWIKVRFCCILLLSVSTPRADQRKFCLERSYCTVEVIPGTPNGTPWGWVPNRLSLLFFIYTFVATQPRFLQGISQIAMSVLEPKSFEKPVSTVFFGRCLKRLLFRFQMNSLQRDLKDI